MHFKRADTSLAFDEQSQLLVVNYTIFLFVSAGIGIFVNLYLWVNSLDIRDILTYQLFSSLTIMPGFLVMLKFTYRLKNTVIYRLGIILYMVFIILILYLRKSSASYDWLLGSISGLALGFFYAGYNSLTYQKVKQKNRILFNSWRNLLSSVVGILAPLIFGATIIIFKGEVGYIITYVVLLVVLIYEFIHSFELTGTSANVKLKLLESFGVTFRNKNYPYMVLADLFWSMASVIMATILTVFIYVVSGSTFVVSVFWIVVGISRTLSSFYIRRFLHNEIVNLSRNVNILNVAASFLVIIYYHLPELIFFAVIYGISSTVIGIMYSTAAMDIIDTDIAPERNQNHYIIMREYILLIARVSGIALEILAFSYLSFGIALHQLIIFTSLLAVITWIVVRMFYRTKEFD